MARAARRGRGATKPTEIPKKGWRDILLRVKDEIATDHVSVTAAGVAFYALLSIFPAIVVLIAIAGLVVDPSQVQNQISALTSALPQGAASIITDQAQKVVDSDGGTGLAAIFGLLLAIYSSSKGVKTLIEGINIAYDEPEGRDFVALNITALALTLFLILGLIVTLSIAIAIPVVAGSIGLSEGMRTLVDYGRWLLVALFAMAGLAVLYRYAPDRENPRWRWVSPGALAGMVLWVSGSIAFSIYIRNFGSYNETYGALGGVIILLTWLWLSAFIVLLGAELNAEMEHQTRRDSTTGRPEPKGTRGAVKADTLGETP